MTAPPRARGGLGDVALIVAGALLISTKGIIVKFIYLEGVSVEAVLLLRAWLSQPLIWAWALYRIGFAGVLRVPRNLVAGALIAGLGSYYLGAWLDFAALTLIDASLERVLLFSYPVIVVIARALTQRRWPPRRVVVAVSMTWCGIALAVGGLDLDLWRVNGFGALLVIASACLFSYYLIANERFAMAAGSVAFIVFATFAAALALTAHFAVFGEATSLDLTPRAWALLVFMTVATNVVPLFMFSASIGRIGAQRASIISSIGPPATIALAVILLGEVMHPVQLLGSALIVAGIVVLEARRSAAVEAG